MKLRVWILAHCSQCNYELVEITDDNGEMYCPKHHFVAAIYIQEENPFPNGV